MPTHLQARPVYLELSVLLIVKLIEGYGILVLRRGKTKLKATLYLKQKPVVTCIEFESLASIFYYGMTGGIVCQRVVS